MGEKIKVKLRTSKDAYTEYEINKSEIENYKDFMLDESPNGLIKGLADYLLDKIIDDFVDYITKKVKIRIADELIAAYKEKLKNYD